MSINLLIANVSFDLSLDKNITSYFYKRVHKIDKKTIENHDVYVTCKRVNNIFFTNEKFLFQQEPDIDDTFLYREIFDLGVFAYNRINKSLRIEYIVSERYPYDSFEVVVDTLLQFIYLIMLDFGIVPLHASVVTYGNNSALIFGNSGSGKTTLELSLLNSGFEFFSDDIAFMDECGTIYNSGEQLIACSNATIDIVKSNFNMDFLQGSFENITGKHLYEVPDRIISQYHEVNPRVILFPTLTNGEADFLEQISNKSTLIKLIQLSISNQFNSYQKQLYMKRLKLLSERTVAFRYNRASKDENALSEVCSIIKEIFVSPEVTI